MTDETTANVEPDMFSLDGRIALVTGASSGIGLHLARAFARAGAAVALAARRRPLIDEAAAQLRAEGWRATAIALDVGHVQTIDAALDEVARAFGNSPDVVVNCAGVLVLKPFLEQTVDEYDAILDTNLRGAFFVAQRAAARMVAMKRGSIINIASTAGLRPGAQLSSYCASKAGLVHLTKVMAVELARHGIRVNALCPGNFETDMHQDFVNQGFADALVKRIPQRRFGRTEDLDGAALLLASDAGRYITGAALAVDGGQLVGSM